MPRKPSSARKRRTQILEELMLGPRTAKQLAKELGLSRQYVKKLLFQLRRYQLVHRQAYGMEPGHHPLRQSRGKRGGPETTWARGPWRPNAINDGYLPDEPVVDEEEARAIQLEVFERYFYDNFLA